MKSDANDLQIGHPFAYGALRDKQQLFSYPVEGENLGSDIIISMAVPHDNWSQNIERRNETISTSG